MKNHWIIGLAAGAVLVGGAWSGLGRSAALGQIVPPFFGPGAVALTPQIETLRTGTTLQAQATVSPDLRYVTITTQATRADLIELREIRFPAGIVGGFVGGVNPATGPAAGPALSAPVAQSPSEVQQRAEGAVLTRRGMTLVHAR